MNRQRLPKMIRHNARVPLLDKEFDSKCLENEDFYPALLLEQGVSRYILQFRARTE